MVWDEDKVEELPTKTVKMITELKKLIHIGRIIPIFLALNLK